MTDFNAIQHLWQQQGNAPKKEPDTIIQKAIKKQQLFQYRQRSTIGILLITVGVLIWYFILYLKTPNTNIKISAGLMIGSILCRITVEVISHWQLYHIDFKQSLKDYTQQFTKFYIFRNRIYFFVTPVTMLLYSLGFMYLLPDLQANMSKGWYLYILISGVIFLVGFSVFLFWNIKREMRILIQIKQIDISIKQR